MNSFIFIVLSCFLIFGGGRANSNGMIMDNFVSLNEPNGQPLPQPKPERKYYWPRPQQQQGFYPGGQFNQQQQYPGQFPGQNLQYPFYNQNSFPPYGNQFAQYPGQNFNPNLNGNPNFFGSQNTFLRPPIVGSISPGIAPIQGTATFSTPAPTPLPLQPGVSTATPLGAGTGFQRPGAQNILLNGQGQGQNPNLVMGTNLNVIPGQIPIQNGQQQGFGQYPYYQG